MMKTLALLQRCRLEWWRLALLQSYRLEWWWRLALSCMLQWWTEIMSALPKLPGGEKVVLPLLQVFQLEVESGADHTTLRQTKDLLKQWMHTGALTSIHPPTQSRRPSTSISTRSSAHEHKKQLYNPESRLTAHTAWSLGGGQFEH